MKICWLVSKYNICASSCMMGQMDTQNLHFTVMIPKEGPGVYHCSGTWNLQQNYNKNKVKEHL
jgi:hypothetical protein